MKFHMKSERLKRIYRMISGPAIVAGAALLSACANMGTPSGGPRDEDPPRLVSAHPAQGALNVDRNKVTLNFNELINVKDAFEKVVVSPPIGRTPRVTSLGRRVTVEFDSLAPNTTYTIDFADAIEDNNEANKLRNFAYTFSTGATIDTLRISGRVLSARSLEPQQGMIVGVQADLADSAFVTRPLLRLAKTDDRGRFVIRGLAPGEYRVFALGDKDNDYMYANPEEDIAFYPVTVSPFTERTVALDTIYTLLGQVDTVIERSRTRFLPNDILLRTFNSEVRPQYLAKYERLDTTRVFLKFNARRDALPKVRAIGFPELEDIGVAETREGLDSIIWWLSPKLRTDSLQLAVDYERPDSLGRPVLLTDTLDFFFKRPKPSKKKKKKEVKISAADSLARITTQFSVVATGDQDIHLPLYFESKTPLAAFDTALVHLQQKVDSTFVPVKGKPFVANADTLNPRRFRVEYPWEYGEEYRLTIDSLAAMDIYGLPTLPLEHPFKVKPESEYCSLTFSLSGLEPGIPAFVELLNNQDALVRTAAVEQGQAFFPFLTPGKYYARVVEDVNGNGVYDTGDYYLQRQPELAYYYPKAINLKKNWDKEEKWDVFATAIDLQKPSAILKNKPERNKLDKKDENEEESEEEDELFDPTRNPFDPNDKGRRRSY